MNPALITTVTEPTAKLAGARTAATPALVSATTATKDYKAHWITVSSVLLRLADAAGRSLSSIFYGRGSATVLTRGSVTTPALI